MGNGIAENGNSGGNLYENRYPYHILHYGYYKRFFYQGDEEKITIPIISGRCRGRKIRICKGDIRCISEKQ